VGLFAGREIKTEDNVEGIHEMAVVWITWCNSAFQLLGLKSEPHLRRHVRYINILSQIQNALSIEIAVSVLIWQNRSNAEIALHAATKTRFG